MNGRFFGDFFEIAIPHIARCCRTKSKNFISIKWHELNKYYSIFFGKLLWCWEYIHAITKPGQNWSGFKHFLRNKLGQWFKHWVYTLYKLFSGTTTRGMLKFEYFFFVPPTIFHQITTNDLCKIRVVIFSHCAHLVYLLVWQYRSLVLRSHRKNYSQLLRCSWYLLVSRLWLFQKRLCKYVLLV